MKKNKIFVNVIWSMLGAVFIVTLVWGIVGICQRISSEQSCHIRCFEEGADDMRVILSDGEFRCFCILTGVPSWESNAEEDNERTENPNDIQQ